MSARLQFCAWGLVALICSPSAAAQLGSDPNLRSAATNGGQTPGALHGRVVDARTGAALGQAPVTLDDGGVSAVSDREGRFAIDAVSPGPHRLSVSLIGYALARRDIVIEPAARLDVTIVLTEGSTTYAEAVTVTPDTFRTPTDLVASGQVLGSADLLNLRGVLADDPLRAVQVLPGVATSDDLRSEFTIRGSDFRHITFT
ncbi:MAG TPA: carboxypeptidase-like regulatory domain-containing protein, partial [Vicinamibacterales bacterium]